VGWYQQNSLYSDFARAKDNGLVSIWPVGQKVANELGIFDASGNVKEWCWDLWTEGGGTARQFRGGSWSAPASQCAVTYRNGSSLPQNPNDDIGFRLARNDNYWDFDWGYAAPRNSGTPVTLRKKHLLPGVGR
jgi:hypothetical protein